MIDKLDQNQLRDSVIYVLGECRFWDNDLNAFQLEVERAIITAFCHRLASTGAIEYLRVASEFLLYHGKLIVESKL